jgi:PHD/YefM family antitoxin component YafN of YafNO toxin-antitoxin module
VRTIPAREIKRRGITAIDDDLREGPVHVIRNDRPSYVVLTEEQYRELVDGYQEAMVSRVKASLEDVAAGRVRRVSADDLIREFELDE